MTTNRVLQGESFNWTIGPSFKVGSDCVSILTKSQIWRENNSQIFNIYCWRWWTLFWLVFLFAFSHRRVLWPRRPYHTRVHCFIFGRLVQPSIAAWHSTFLLCSHKQKLSRRPTAGEDRRVKKHSLAPRNVLPNTLFCSLRKSHSHASDEILEWMQ